MRRPPSRRTLPASPRQWCPSSTTSTWTRVSLSSDVTGRCKVGRPSTTTRSGRCASMNAWLPSRCRPASSTDGPAAPAASEITRCPDAASSSASGCAIAATNRHRSSAAGSGTNPETLLPASTAVHGPVRPASKSGHASAAESGSKGSARHRFSCTGPGRPPTPRAAPTARHTIERQRAF